VFNSASGLGANGVNGGALTNAIEKIKMTVSKNDGMEWPKQILSEARSEAERKFDLF